MRILVALDALRQDTHGVLADADIQFRDDAKFFCEGYGFERGLVFAICQHPAKRLVMMHFPVG